MHLDPAAGGIELCSICQQIRDNLLHPVRINAERPFGALSCPFDSQLLRIQLRPNGVQRRLNQRVQRGRLEIQGQFPRRYARHIEQVLYEPGLDLRVSFNTGNAAGDGFGQIHGLQNPNR